MKSAAENWTFIHSVEYCSARTTGSLEVDLYEHKNTITFKVIENLKWMYETIYSNFILK